MKEDDPLVPDILEQSMQRFDDGHLIQTKKQLIKSFILFLTMSLLLIVERVLYPFIIQFEKGFLESLQSSLALVFIGKDGIQRFNNNFLFNIVSGFHEGGLNIMIFTNFFITLYVGFDALLAIKIMYISYFSNFLLVFIQLLYSDPRPFWIDEKLSTSSCLTSYGNPSAFVLQLGLTLFYSAYCYKIKNFTLTQQYKDPQFDKKFKIAQIAIVIVIAIYGILLFLLALEFLMNIILGALYTLIFYHLAISFDKQINIILKQSTITNIDSKILVFGISFILIAIEMLIIITFEGIIRVADIKWISNMLRCLQANNIQRMEVPSNLIMGPKFTFDKTSIVFCLIGALFGVSHCFRNIKILKWYRGNPKKRLFRIGVANLCTIPGWIIAAMFKDITVYTNLYDLGMSIFIVFEKNKQKARISMVPYILFYFIWIITSSCVSQVTNKRSLSRVNLKKEIQENFFFILIQKKKNNLQKKQMTNKMAHRQRLGDWVCKGCQNMNFSFRSSCNRCDANREEKGFKSALFLTESNGDIPPLGELDRSLHNISLDKLPAIDTLLNQTKKTQKSGKYGIFDFEWSCPLCNQHNYYYKSSCHSCQFQKRKSTM